MWDNYESSLSWRAGLYLYVFFIYTHVQYETLQLHGFTVNEPQIYQLCHATVICDLFRNSINFCLQLLNSGWVVVVHTIFEVTPKEINTGIHAWWTWWPGAPTTKVLWKWIWQYKATKYIMQDDIHCMWTCTTFLGKCVHIPSYQTDLILQLPHAVCHLAQCMALYLPSNFWYFCIHWCHLSLFPLVISLVTHVSNCCAFFWALCMLL